MKIIDASIEVLKFDKDSLKLIEKAGRTCYKSEDKITEDSAEKFVKMLNDRNHTAMLEHSFASVKVICDRGVTHEIVRHRLFSYAQESTRYCNYSKDKFGKELTVILPNFLDVSETEESIEKFNIWYNCMKEIEKNYFKMLELGMTPQEARSILPNSLKTEIVISGNFREWIHFFKLRCAKEAHPQMREIALLILKEFNKLCPILFKL